MEVAGGTSTIQAWLGVGGWAVRAGDKDRWGEWTDPGPEGRYAAGPRGQGWAAELQASGGRGEPPSPGKGEWDRGGGRPWEGLWTSVEGVMRAPAGRGSRDAGRTQVWTPREGPPGERGRG